MAWANLCIIAVEWITFGDALPHFGHLHAQYINPIDAIPFHMFSRFHFLLRFAWPFFSGNMFEKSGFRSFPNCFLQFIHNAFFSSPIEPSRVLEFHKTTDRFFFVDRSLSFVPYKLACTLFRSGQAAFVVRSTAFVLMSVFIYSWFACLCDKDGGGNRLMVFLRLIHFFNVISAVQTHMIHKWFRAANVLINLLLSSALWLSSSSRA